ncbi:MAG: acetyltransferase [Candidatus Rifleibacteriota bacterium]
MSSAKNLVILGAGGQAKVVITTARLCGYEPDAIYDDDESKKGLEFAGVPVVGRIVDLPDDFDKASFIAIGSNLVRKKIFQRLRKAVWVSLIHPTAFVCATARIGDGTIICAGARIMVEADIGCQVIINTGANIDHECGVGDFVHVCPGCNLAGAVELEEGCFVGTGASVIPLKKVGAWATVGAGAVVVKNVPENVTVVGVPARILKK